MSGGNGNTIGAPVKDNNTYVPDSSVKGSKKAGVEPGWDLLWLNKARKACGRASVNPNNGLLTVRTPAYFGMRIVSILTTVTNLVSMVASGILWPTTACCGNYMGKTAAKAAKELKASVLQFPIVGEIGWAVGKIRSCCSKSNDESVDLIHRSGHRNPLFIPQE